MIFLGELEQVRDNSYKVGFIHYLPFDEKEGLNKSIEELEQEGVLVESIPEAEEREGKTPILYCNTETKELWYEYEDIPKTKEELLVEKVNQLESALMETTVLLAQLAQEQSKNAQNEQAIMELSTIVAGGVA